MLNSVHKMMQCSAAIWSVCLSHYEAPYTSSILEFHMQQNPKYKLLFMHSYGPQQLTDLCFCTDGTAVETPFPTPRASLNATMINEISHADEAAAAPEKYKNLCRCNSHGRHFRNWRMGWNSRSTSIYWKSPNSSKT